MSIRLVGMALLLSNVALVVAGVLWLIKGPYDLFNQGVAFITVIVNLVLIPVNFYITFGE